jgi:hypothetical protein
MKLDKHAIIHLFHILLVGPLFLYVGIKRDSIPSLMFPFLLVLGTIVILYHAYLAYNKFKQGLSAWVNYIHFLIIGPLLVYIGYHGLETSRKFYELLLLLGMSTIGYHGYYLLQG